MGLQIRGFGRKWVLDTMEFISYCCLRTLHETISARYPIMNQVHTSRECRHDVGPLDGAAGKQGDGDVGNGPARERGHRSAAAPGRHFRGVSAVGEFPRFATQGNGRTAEHHSAVAGKAGRMTHAGSATDAAMQGSGTRVVGTGGRISHQGATTTKGRIMPKGATAVQGSDVRKGATTTQGRIVRKGATTPAGEITPRGTTTDTRPTGRRQGAGVFGSGRMAVGAACAGVFASRPWQSALKEGETACLPFQAGAVFSGRRRGSLPRRSDAEGVREGGGRSGNEGIIVDYNRRRFSHA